MMKFMLLLTILPMTVFAQSMDLDYSNYCKEFLEREYQGLDCDNIPSVSINKKDDRGNTWKIRFHFGFSRTQYHTTDLNVKSTIVNIEVKDVVMHERTSGQYYNPKNWEGAGDALKWIDEPTNTFALSFEKKKHKIYITVFHPKYIKSVLYRKDSNGNFEFKESQPDNKLNQERFGHNMLYLQNTHKNLIWQVGYGYELTIFDSKKGGKLSYIPKVDIGINTGMARSAHIDQSGDFQDFKGKTEIQGYNASVAHRLEYQKGKVSLFIDHKTIFTKMKHGFYDGTADYSLRLSPVTFGVGIDVFTGKSKERKRKKKRKTGD